MRKIGFPLLICSFLLFLFVGCDTAAVSMPYGSEEYENGDWTVEELINHFEELGFSDINVTNELEIFGNDEIGIYNVLIEDTSSDSLFTEYRTIEKGEEVGNWLKVKIETYTSVPLLTKDNSAEFAELIKMDAPILNETLMSFMDSHNGEYLEFDGTITDWYDDVFWVGVSFTITVENSECLEFSWSTMDLSDLDLGGEYEYSKYKAGAISERMQVHMITKIVTSENEWHLEIESMQIVE